MSKTGKILLWIISIVVLLIILGYLLCAASWHGVFDSKEIKEIATYNSPDGKYFLVFEQIGDPAWPYGSTDVRLTLKDHNGKMIERVSTQIQDDGLNAGEHSVMSISWNDNAVVIILQGSEMQDKEVSISYNQN
jgi:hypothetical protein